MAGRLEELVAERQLPVLRLAKFRHWRIALSNFRQNPIRPAQRQCQPLARRPSRRLGSPIAFPHQLAPARPLPIGPRAAARAAMGGVAVAAQTTESGEQNGTSIGISVTCGARGWYTEIIHPAERSVRCPRRFRRSATLAARGCRNPSQRVVLSANIVTPARRLRCVGRRLSYGCFLGSRSSWLGGRSPTQSANSNEA
jgi:hypothetical protein